MTENTTEDAFTKLRKAFDNLEDHCEPMGGAEFHWCAKSFGFGGFYFYYDDNDKLMCSNECMSKEFIKRMLCNMVDSCELTDN